MKRQPMFGLFGKENNGRWTPFRWFDADLDAALDALNGISRGHWCIMEDEESKPIYEAEKTEFDAEVKLFYTYRNDHWWNYRAGQYQRKFAKAGQ